MNRRDPISTGGHDPFTAGMFCEPRDEAFYLGDTWHHDMDICPQGCADVQGVYHTSTSIHCSYHLACNLLGNSSTHSTSFSLQVILEEIAIMDHVYATKDFMGTIAVRHRSTDLRSFS